MLGRVPTDSCPIIPARAVSFQASVGAGHSQLPRCPLGVFLSFLWHGTQPCSGLPLGLLTSLSTMEEPPEGECLE